MSCYIMKVTRHTVKLANGEDANVAVFARRNDWDVGSAHVTSGAAACDRAAAEGKRGPWVILGFQRDDGKIEVDVGDSAKKIGVVGSFPDDWFDRKDADTSKPSRYAKPKAPILLTKTVKTIPDETGFGSITKGVLGKDGWATVSREAYRAFGPGRVSL